MALDEQTKARLALTLPIVLGAAVIWLGLSLRKGDDEPANEPGPDSSAVNRGPASEANPAAAESEPAVVSQAPASPAADSRASRDIEAVTPAIALDANGNQVRLESIPDPTPAPIAAASRETLNQPDQEPEADLAFIQDALSTYRTAFQSNPFGGENEEIVAGLTGRNAKGLVVIPPDHPAINDQGQLTDRWGTPYHFHPVSREEMDVTSAGPDRKLFTDDDVRLDFDFE